MRLRRPLCFRLEHNCLMVAPRTCPPGSEITDRRSRDTRDTLRVQDHRHDQSKASEQRQKLAHVGTAVQRDVADTAPVSVE